MKSKRSRKSRLLGPVLVISMALLASCGGDDDDSTTVVVNPDEPQQQEEEGPVDTGPTVIVNNRIVNNVRVNASRTRVQNRRVFLNWQCRNVAPVVHKQFIHISVRCPTIQDDTNGDGIVDPVEVEQAIGPRVLALDTNVESAEQESFPSGRSYTYNQSIPLGQLRQSVPPGQDFVVMIHGASENTALPATYTTTTNDPAHLTVPIACKVFNAPVIIDNGGTTTGGTTTGGTTTGGTTTGTTTTGGTNGGTTTGGTDGGSTGGNGGLSCDADIQIDCLPGHHDGCDTGETDVHACVPDTDSNG